jgi:hypothetical protein
MEERIKSFYKRRSEYLRRTTKISPSQASFLIKSAKIDSWCVEKSSLIGAKISRDSNGEYLGIGFAIHVVAISGEGEIATARAELGGAITR